MPFSQYLSQSTLNWFRTQQFDAPPSNLFISLHTANPGVNGVDADVTVSVAGARGTLSSANLSAPTSSPAPSGGFQVSNTSPVLMTSSAQAPAVLTFFGLWNSVSGGSFLAYAPLDSPVSVSAGDVLQFTTAQLIIRAI
jgi:hypothetical protein